MAKKPKNQSRDILADEVDEIEEPEVEKPEPVKAAKIKIGDLVYRKPVKQKGLPDLVDPQVYSVTNVNKAVASVQWQSRYDNRMNYATMLVDDLTLDAPK